MQISQTRITTGERRDHIIRVEDTATILLFFFLLSLSPPPRSVRIRLDDVFPNNCNADVGVRKRSTNGTGGIFDKQSRGSTRCREVQSGGRTDLETDRRTGGRTDG